MQVTLSQAVPYVRIDAIGGTSSIVAYLNEQGLVATVATPTPQLQDEFVQRYKSLAGVID